MLEGRSWDLHCLNNHAVYVELSMVTTHCVLGHMCTLLAEQTVLSMFRLFSICHCKILCSTLPSFRGSVQSVLTQMPASAQNFFFMFSRQCCWILENDTETKIFCDFMCWSRNTMSGNTILRKLTVQQSVGPRTITQPAFIRVLTLFSIYFTALLHINCGLEFRASAVFSKPHFFQS